MRQLAEGGYGVVWLARDRTLERDAVVKLLKPHAAEVPQEAARFVEEARITASISHPNVVVVFDHGVAEGTPWIAYERLAGPDLRDHLQGRLPVAEAIAILADVAAGVAEAHRRGVTHRDLKPDNVMSDGQGRWKVTDFGIAKWAASQVRTATGVVMGTPYYISPEQIEGAPATARADVYALGIMLYEMLVGEVPFGGDQIALVLERHVRSRVPSPCAARPEVPEWLGRLVVAATARAPAERPADAGELAQALERRGRDAAAGGRPRGAGPVSRRKASTSSATQRVVRDPAADTPAPARPASRGLTLLACACACAIAVFAVHRRPSSAVVVASPVPPSTAAEPSVAASPVPSEAAVRESRRAEDRLYAQRGSLPRDEYRTRLTDILRARARLQDALKQHDRLRETYQHWRDQARAGNAAHLIEELAWLAGEHYPVISASTPQPELLRSLAEHEELVALDPGNAAAWARLGILRRRLGQAEAAVAALQRALGTTPQPAWELELALALTALDKLDAAAPHFRSGMKDRGAQPETLVFAGLRYEQRAGATPADHALAKRLYEAALAVAPESPVAQVHVALVRARDGQAAAAQALVDAAAREQPVLWTFLSAIRVHTMGGDDAGALRWARAAMGALAGPWKAGNWLTERLRHSLDGDLFLTAMREHVARGRIDAALAVARAGLLLDPEARGLGEYYSAFCQEHGRSAALLALVKTLLVAEPGPDWAHQVELEYLYATSQIERALDSARRWRRLAPRDNAARLALARVYLGLHRAPEAVAELAPAMAWPQFGDERQMMARCLLECDPPRLPEARHWLELASQELPHLAETHALLIRLARLEHRNADAQRLLADARRDFPDDSTVRMEEVALLEDQHQVAAAERILRDIARGLPGKHWPHARLAENLRLQGRNAEADAEDLQSPDPAKWPR